jgi:hypothetical protein
MKLSKPWPADKKERSGFGYRIHPINGRRQLHRGIDVGGQFPISAPATGVVVHIGWSPNGGGHTLILDHGDIHTAYYHLREATPLRLGERVAPGAFLGTSGSTGLSTGNHLHFEVRTRKTYGTQVDPQPYLVSNNLGAKPALRVDGRMGKNTWRAWQTQLAEAGHYKGRVDGKPGSYTYRAIQRAVGVTVDGQMGPQTRKAVQEQLHNWGYYIGRVDGVWGRVTYRAIQRSLNDEQWCC